MTTAAEQAPAATSDSAPADQGHGAQIITALESAWEAIRARHGQIRPVVMITGTKRQLGGSRLGHYGANRWVAADEPSGRAAELFIAGELIKRGGRLVMETLLHEAGHALAHARGVRDMSNDRYHSGEFAAVAQELGLQLPEAIDRRHGWSFCTLPDATADRCADAIAELDAAGLPYLEGPITAPGDVPGPAALPTAPGQRAGRRFAVACQCATPRVLQLSPKAWEGGGIMCVVCWQPFTPVPTPKKSDG